MFPADTADFYQIFLHIKQIIRPYKSQPYIKKKKTRKKYRYYRNQIFSILAITTGVQLKKNIRVDGKQCYLVRSVKISKCWVWCNYVMSVYFETAYTSFYVKTRLTISLSGWFEESGDRQCATCRESLYYHRTIYSRVRSQIKKR